MQESRTWNLAQWDAFIEGLVSEKAELIDDTCMQLKMQEVKKCWEERPRRIDVRPEVPELSFDGYLKWGNKVENAQRLADVYYRVYQLLQEMQEDSLCKWEELAVKAELDAYIRQWEKWQRWFFGRGDGDIYL